MEGLGNYEREERPWGLFERFIWNEQATVKLVTVAPGEAFSLQTHEHRDEFWRVVQGSGRVTVGEEEKPASVGDSFFTPRGTKHRAQGGPQGLTLLEIAFGEFDENDVKRLDDRYGRAG